MPYTDPIAAFNVRQSAFYEAFDAAHTELIRILSVGQDVRLTIPTDPKRDTDMLIVAALDAGRALAAALEAQPAPLDNHPLDPEERGVLDTMIHASRLGIGSTHFFEQPAPQRPTEDGGVWGSYVDYLARLEAQPAPLDPEPWARFADGDGGPRSATNDDGFLYWYPRDGYEKDSTRYAQPAPLVADTEEAQPVFRFTDEQWRAYQQTPDQGYSHRHHLAYVFNQWLLANNAVRVVAPGVIDRDAAIEALVQVILNRSSRPAHPPSSVAWLGLATEVYDALIAAGVIR